MNPQDDSEPLATTRPGPRAIRKRPRQLLVMLNDAEHARLEKLKKETSLSAAAIIRRLLTDQKISSTIDIQAVNELRRQGGLLKHVVASLQDSIDPTTQEKMLELARIIHRIAEEIRNGI